MTKYQKMVNNMNMEQLRELEKVPYDKRLEYLKAIEKAKEKYLQEFRSILEKM